MKLFELNAQDPDGNISLLHGTTTIRLYADSVEDAYEKLLWDYELLQDDFEYNEIREVPKKEIKTFQLQMSGWCQKIIEVSAENHDDAVEETRDIHLQQDYEDLKRNIPESFHWTSEIDHYEVGYCEYAECYQTHVRGNCSKTLQVTATDIDDAYEKLMELHDKQDEEHSADNETHGICHQWDDVWLEEIQLVA